MEIETHQKQREEYINGDKGDFSLNCNQLKEFLYMWQTNDQEPFAMLVPTGRQLYIYTY